MSVAQKEEAIIKLNDERLRIIKLLKKTKSENALEYEKRLEKINEEIERLIYG